MVLFTEPSKHLCLIYMRSTKCPSSIVIQLGLYSSVCCSGIAARGSSSAVSGGSCCCWKAHISKFKLSSACNPMHYSVYLTQLYALLFCCFRIRLYECSGFIMQPFFRGPHYVLQTVCQSVCQSVPCQPLTRKLNIVPRSKMDESFPAWGVTGSLSHINDVQ